jgi:murein DD-endopeptidase MepM/ murein hydrolase activator NlpD
VFLKKGLVLAKLSFFQLAGEDMERKPRKINKKYTIMFIPHSNSAIKSLPIPFWLINSLAVCGLISLIVVGYLTFSYFYLHDTLVENEELKTINDVQAEEIRELQKVTQETLYKLEEIEETDQKIRELVGLKESTEKEQLTSRSQGGLGTSGRSIQILGAGTFDILETLPITPGLEFPEITKGITYELDKEPNLNTVKKIKNDLQLINEKMMEREDALAQLEVEVKERLDYLESIPSGWPVKGRITSTYGWRKNPFNKKTKEFHEGIDIAAAYGTAIRAAGKGKVTFTGWKPAFGNTVIIKHGYGYISQYAHNSKINVKVGQVVNRGDIIARIGNSGRSTGPHVDFRILFNGRYLDPLKVLK